LRSNVYEIMDKQMPTKDAAISDQTDSYNELIDTLIPQCERQFERSSELKKKYNRVDEYG